MFQKWWIGVVFAMFFLSTAVGLSGCVPPSSIPTQTEDSLLEHDTIAPTSERPLAGTVRPSADNQSYQSFNEFVMAIPKKFSPAGFRLINHLPGNAVYYGFEPEMAWNKRSMTIVDNDDNKLSQTEFFVSHEDNSAQRTAARISGLQNGTNRCIHFRRDGLLQSG